MGDPSCVCSGRDALGGWSTLQGGSCKSNQFRGVRCEREWQDVWVEPLEVRELLVSDEIWGRSGDNRGEEDVEMEHRFGGGPAPVGREMDVDWRRVNACHKCRLFGEFARRSIAEAGVTGFDVSANWAPLSVAAVAGEQDAPIGLDNQHAGYQMGIVTVTGIEERQRRRPHRITSSRHRGRRQERSR